MTEAEKFLNARGGVPCVRDRFDFDSYSREYETRKAFIAEFGFAILTEWMVKRLAKYGPLVEVGSGSGYWSFELRKAGVDVVATDIAPGADNDYSFRKREPWIAVEKLSAVEAVRKYSNRTLLSVWPCYDEEWITEALRAYTGDTFILSSEGVGGCVASDSLFELLAKKWKLVEDIGGSAVPVDTRSSRGLPQEGNYREEISLRSLWEILCTVNAGWRHPSNGQLFIGGEWRSIKAVYPAGLDWYRLTFFNYPVTVARGSQQFDWRKNGNG